jgi:hypothetical protein
MCTWIIDRLIIHDSSLFLFDISVFVGAGYDSVVPDAPNASTHPLTKTLAEKTSKWVEQYLDAMEKVPYFELLTEQFQHCMFSHL